LSPPISPSTADPAGRPAPPVSRCPHCGTAVEGADDAFCCLGCEHAAAIIRGAGLERYYAEREAYAPRPEPAAGGWAEVPTETCADGSLSARLMVDGLRCASCVWVTEQVLEGTDGVRAAVVSYASGRATLRWDPARTDLPALARRIAALGYRPRPLDAAPTPDRDLLARLGVAAVAAVAVMGLYEGLYAGWWYGGMDPRFAALFRWTSLLIATPVALWCATPFYAGAAAGLRGRVLHMDLPVALGIGVPTSGLVMTLGQDAYLDSRTLLVALLLGGRVLESRGRRRAAEAASALAASVPRTARRAVGEALETVAVDQLRIGDLVDAGAGEEIAADGVITEGSGQVRMALLTGESEPILLGPGAGRRRRHPATRSRSGWRSVRHWCAHGRVIGRRAMPVAPTAADRLAPCSRPRSQTAVATSRGAQSDLAESVPAWWRCWSWLPCASRSRTAAAAGLGLRPAWSASLHRCLLALNDVTLVAWTDRHRHRRRRGDRGRPGDACIAVN
jgi:copper chaperone CopZ